MPIIQKKIILIAVFLLILFLLCLAPWLNDQELHDKILQEKGRIDGTIDEGGKLVCDYKVSWIPFGRWVASCEGGYYITFYGHIL